MDVAVGTGDDFNAAETSLLVEEILIFDLAEDEAGRGLAARGDEILKPAGFDEGEQAPEEEGFARLGELERLDGVELAEEGSQPFTDVGSINDDAAGLPEVGEGGDLGVDVGVRLADPELALEDVEMGEDGSRR